SPLHLWGFLWRWPWGSRDTLVRERVSAGKLGAVLPRAPSLTPDPSPSRIDRKSYGPRVPNRTMVAKFDHRSALLVSELTGFVAKKRWKPLGQSSRQPSTWCGRPEQNLLN